MNSVELIATLWSCLRCTASDATQRQVLHPLAACLGYAVAIEALTEMRRLSSAMPGIFRLGDSWLQHVVWIVSQV